VFGNDGSLLTFHSPHSILAFIRRPRGFLIGLAVRDARHLFADIALAMMIMDYVGPFGTFFPPDRPLRSALGG